MDLKSLNGQELYDALAEASELDRPAIAAEIERRDEAERASDAAWNEWYDAR